MQVQLLAYLRIVRKVVVFLFNVALNIFYFRFYGVRHVVKIESDGKWVNPLSPLYGLFFSIQYNKVFNVHIQSKLCFRLAVSDIIYHYPIDGTVQITGFNTHAFAHGAMGRRIDHSWWTHWAISRSSKCSTIGVTKAAVCVMLSMG